MSGSSRVEVDIASYLSFMGMSDTSESPANYMDTFALYFYTAANYLQSAEGISNVKWDASEESSTLYITFDFNNIAALNHVLANDPVGFDEMIGGKPYFAVKGKKLSYFFGTSGKEMEDAEDYESMKDMFAYNLNFSFERKIGKVAFPGLEVSGDKQSAAYKSSIFDLPALDPKKPMVFALK